MKGILFLIFLLSSWCTSAFAGPLNFPVIDTNKLTPLQKEMVLRDLHHFIKEYEKKQVESYSSVQTAPMNMWELIQNAYALDPQNMCMYGGWPSERTSSGCIRPQLKNSTYKEKYADKCGEGELYCNPTLFGHDLCIPFSNRDERISAYQNCNRKFNAEGRTLEEVVAQADGAELNDMLSSAKNVCSFGKQAGTGMCMSLVRKLNSYIDVGTPIVVEQLIQANQSKDPDHVVQSMNAASDRLDVIQKQLNEECGLGLAKKSQEEYQAFFDKLDPAQQQKCLDLNNEFTELAHYVETMLGELEANDPELFQEIQCGATIPSVLDEKVATEFEEVVEEAECLPEVAARKRQNCKRDIYCAAISSMFTPFAIINDLAGKEDNECISSDNSCVANLVTAFAKNITDLVTGLFDLAVMGLEWAGDKIQQGWNWMWGIEDKTSNAGNDLAGMSPDQLEELEQDPRAWYEKLWDGINTSFNTFLKEHVGCERWSGVPHYSKCLEPFTSFECMSCKTYITGTCTALGYILPEVLTLIGSGGIGNLIKGGATASKVILKSVTTSAKFKKMTTIGKSSLVAKTYGKVAAKSSKALGVVKTVGGKAITKLKPVGQWGNNIIKKGFARFMNSTEVYIAKQLMKKMSKLKQVVVKQVGNIKKLALKGKDKLIENTKLVANSKVVQGSKAKIVQVANDAKDLTIKVADKTKTRVNNIGNRVYKTADVEIDAIVGGGKYVYQKGQQAGNWIGKGYRKVERAINDPLYRLSDNLVAGSYKTARRINPGYTISRTGTSVGVKGGTKVLTLGEMKNPYYPMKEIDDYFASFKGAKPNKYKYYMDFLQDVGEKYPNISKAKMDELHNMMYNIHKTCNPVWPSKKITDCKKRMLATFKRFLKDEYPAIDPKHVNLMARADVRILGEADEIVSQLDTYAKYGSSFDSKMAQKARLTSDELADLDENFTKLITSRSKIDKFSLDVSLEKLTPEEFSQMEKFWADYYNEISDVIGAGKASGKNLVRLQEIQKTIKDGPLREFNHYRTKTKYSDKFKDANENVLRDSNVDVAAKVEQETFAKANQAIEDINNQYRPDLFGSRLDESKNLPLDQRAAELKKLSQETVTDGGAGNYASKVYSEFRSGSGKSKYGQDGKFIPEDKIFNYDEIKNVNTAAKADLEEVGKIRQRLGVIDESYTKPNTYTKYEIDDIAERAQAKLDDGMSPADVKKYKEGSYANMLDEQNALKRQLIELQEMGNKGYFSDEMVVNMSGRGDMTVTQYMKNLEGKIKQAEDNIKMLETEMSGL